MKNKILTIFTLFFLSAITIFAILNQEKLPKYKILDVVEADKFYIDINKNNKIDENELVQLKNTKAFSPDKKEELKEITKELNISTFDYLKNGYLARTWAKDNLINKEVFVKGLSNCKNSSNICEVEIFLDKNTNLSNVLIEYGLAYSKEKSPKINNNQIKNNIKEISILDFVIINLKNGIAHNLSCEYSDKINFARLELKTKLLENKRCKICAKTDKNKYSIPKNKKSYTKSNVFNFENINLYLISPLEYKKPNFSCVTPFCKRLIDEINSAKDSLDIALYGIGEQEEIKKALIKAKERGVKIRLVLDYSLNTQTIHKDSFELAKLFDTTFDKKDSLMHNKFIIFDNKLVMSGSANISSTGSGGYNSNIVFFIDNKETVERYKAEFEQMHNNNFSTNKAKIELQNSSNIKVFFSPKDNILKEIIIPKIQNAKKNIYVSAFYLTQYELINELINAKKRGVDVLIIVDALSATNFKNRISLLRDNQIPAMVENWGGKNHEKTILIDDDTLISGSCNFSKNGFNKNDENVLVIKNKNLAKLYSDYFLFLFNSINKKYLYLFPSAEGLESINSCYDKIDNDFDNKIDKEEKNCLK